MQVRSLTSAAAGWRVVWCPDCSDEPTTTSPIAAWASFVQNGYDGERGVPIREEGVAPVIASRGEAGLITLVGKHWRISYLAAPGEEGSPSPCLSCRKGKASTSS